MKTDVAKRGLWSWLLLLEDGVETFEVITSKTLPRTAKDARSVIL